MTPSLFDLPIRPPEAAKLAVLVLEQAAEKPLTDEIRNRIAGRAALLKLENLKPWFGSMERDPFHPSAIYCMVEGVESQPFLLRLAPNATPSSGLFPKSILIGRMPGPGGAELVVNAVPFAFSSGATIAAFTAKVNRAFQPRPRGMRSAIIVESLRPETVLPAAFDVFRGILKQRGLNFAGAANTQVGSWSAIRSGWREGFVSDTKDALPAAQLKERQRAVCVVQINEPSEAAMEIEKCSRYLL